MQYTWENYHTIDSNNGLSPVWRQPNVWNNVGLLSIKRLGTNSRKTSKLNTAVFNHENELKISFVKWQPFCPWQQCVKMSYEKVRNALIIGWVIVHLLTHYMLHFSGGNKNINFHFMSFLHISSLGCNYTWWRHQMETFFALLVICAGNSPVLGEFPAQRPVTRSCDVSFDLRLYKRLSKQSWGWWFEALSCPLWRHCNDVPVLDTRFWHISPQFNLWSNFKVANCGQRWLPCWKYI